MRYREEFERMICDGGYEWFITLNFNRRCGEQSSRRALKRWSAWLNRKWIGPKWYLKPQRHMNFIAIAEHMLTNIHFHVLARNVEQSHKRVPLHEDVQNAWSAIVPAGTSTVMRISDLAGLASYVTKELRTTDREFSYFLSSEFCADGFEWDPDLTSKQNLEVERLYAPRPGLFSRRIRK